MKEEKGDSFPYSGLKKNKEMKVEINKKSQTLMISLIKVLNHFDMRLQVDGLYYH